MSAVTHLEASGRPTNLTSIGGIVELETLPVYAVGTKDVVPCNSSEDIIKGLI
jgi:hypothetical protein